MTFSLAQVLIAVLTSPLVLAGIGWLLRQILLPYFTRREARRIAAEKAEAERQANIPTTAQQIEAGIKAALAEYKVSEMSARLAKLEADYERVVKERDEARKERDDYRQKAEREIERLQERVEELEQQIKECLKDRT